MILINLLPHRAEARRDRRNQTYVLTIIAVIVGFALMISIYGWISALVTNQEKANSFLKSEISKLDKDIDEIRKLKEQIQGLLSRKQVIESLQANRSESVNLFNELVRQVPDGIYMTKIVQKDLKISINGVAESDTRVAALFKAMEASPFLKEPKIIEISATQQGTRIVKNFSMEVTIVRRTTEDDKGKDNKGAVAKKPT